MKIAGQTTAREAGAFWRVSGSKINYVEAC
jgi:hypothetical protein